MLKYIYSSLVILGTFFVGTHIESMEGADSLDPINKVDDIVENLHPAFQEFDTSTTHIFISSDSTDYVIESTGLPKHKTVYWGDQNELYSNESILKKDKNNINDLNNSFKITVDATPNLSGNLINTGLNTVGVAINGVSIFSHQNTVDLIEDSIGSYDWTGGRTADNLYHYQLEPKAITNNDDKLVGVLKDGIFIYGRKCSAINDYPKDLDVSGGHFAPTQHNPKGEYHYHIKNKTFGNTNSYVIFEGPYQGF